MGRVKIAPTPRNTALDDAMRRAAATVTSSSHMNPDLVRPLPRPDMPSRPPVKELVKSHKLTPPTGRTSRDTVRDRLSVASNKRKSESVERATLPTKKPATEKLVLRSAAKSAPNPSRQVTTKETSPASSLATAVEPARRPTRSTKTASSVDDVAVTDQALSVPPKPSRSLRTQKKTTKATQSLTPEQHERHQAVAMLQGEEIHEEAGNTVDEADSPLAVRSTRGSTRAKSSRASTSLPSSPPDELSSEHQYSPGQSVAKSTSQEPALAEAAIDSTSLSSKGMVQLHNVHGFKIDNPAGLPILNPFAPVTLVSDSATQVAYAYPAPDVTPVPYPYNAHVNGFNSTDPTVGYNNPQCLPIDKGPIDGSSASSGDSGYVTSNRPQDSTYMGSSPYNNDFVPPYPPLLPANQMPVQFMNSTKGQKVKGRPSPRNPKPQDEDSQRGGRNVANTYPRKQPFKAQIEFPGYPPANAPIPDDYSLWEVCQSYPNSLRENSLLAFVQREWSANELCACLKDDAREILNGRPGKDKTMVFQKRMERIKKDLIAKGEYENLLHGPMLREDGRPTWVKRGNVRRK